MFFFIVGGRNSTNTNWRRWQMKKMKTNWKAKREKRTNKNWIKKIKGEKKGKQKLRLQLFPINLNFVHSRTQTFFIIDTFTFHTNIVVHGDDILIDSRCGHLLLWQNRIFFVRIVSICGYITPHNLCTNHVSCWIAYQLLSLQLLHWVCFRFLIFPWTDWFVKVFVFQTKLDFIN